MQKYPPDVNVADELAVTCSVEEQHTVTADTGYNAQVGRQRHRDDRRRMAKQHLHRARRRDAHRRGLRQAITQPGAEHTEDGPAAPTTATAGSCTSTGATTVR